MLHDSATIQANHERFVSRVAESEVIWGLQGRTGFAVCPSNDDEERQVLMFWSDSAYASRVKQIHFPEYEPVQISLFNFLFRWLSGMEDDGVFAGTNWNGDLAGCEIEPGELRDQLLGVMLHGPAGSLGGFSDCDAALQGAHAALAAASGTQ
jgi:hypothetical protein